MVDFGILKGEYDSQMMLSLIREVFESEASLDLVSIMIIIQKILPFYPSLGVVGKDQITELIGGSFIFFSQVVNFTHSMDPNQKEARIYKVIILDVLRKRDCLYNYIKTTSGKLEHNSINSLFFGSKVFNLLIPEIDILNYLEILKFQWTNLFDKSSFQNSLYGSLLISMLTLHPTLCPDVVFGQLVFTNDEYYRRFQTLIRNSTFLDQKRILRFLLPYLELHTNASSYSNVWAILQPLPLYKAIDLDVVLSFKSEILQELVLRLMPEGKKSTLILPLIRRFSECSNQDDQVCRVFVITLMFKMDSTEKDTISRNPNFLDAVTKRLAHEDHVVRERTMYVAKVVTEGKLQYDSEFTIKIPQLNLPQAPIKPDYGMLKQAVSSQENNTALSSSTPPIQELTRLEISKDLEPIVFIKDLVKNFESLESKLLVPLLQSTVKLIRQKKDFPQEVAFYSSSLLVQLSTLNNNLDEPNFENWRLNSIVSLLVVTPEKILDLQRILFNSELSIQQRMSVLTAMGFAARELRGLDNGASIIAPKYDFPTERLPWDHQSRPQNYQLDDEPVQKSALAFSQFVWKSKRLDKSSESSNKNNFREHAPVFFYPLAHSWFNGIELGTYDRLFKRHYMQTITMIYHCSYPHKDYEEMTETMLQLTTQALQQGIEP